MERIMEQQVSDKQKAIDFIEVYEGAYSKEYCDMVIEYFHNMQKIGFSKTRQEADGVNKTMKDDSRVFATEASSLRMNASAEVANVFNGTFWGDCYTDYASKYDILKDIGSHASYEVKIQKTEIGGGYHVWHAEADSRHLSNRLLAFVLYLNDVEEGGETEFLYQHKRVSPKAGTLVIFPAAFTHTHRGNPPLSNAKYILTGWVEF